MQGGEDLSLEPQDDNLTEEELIASELEEGEDGAMVEDEADDEESEKSQAAGKDDDDGSEDTSDEDEEQGPDPEIAKNRFEELRILVSNAKKAIELNKPLLGICAGFNNILRALGGDVVVDKTNKHNYLDKDYRHSIKIEKESELFKIIEKDSLEVNSIHSMVATVEEVEKRISGIKCGFKNTSCGDQLAKAVREVYNAANA